MNDSIDDLRSRWEEDPSPQIAMQLAEEYRRLDRRAEAVEVLARLLEEHPGHVASRVAMSRYRIEMGEIEEARDLLEQVVAEDPTHLVASKLLVEVYLRLDDRRQAKDRLDLYRLLNETDPAIDDLERRLSGESPAVEVPGVEDREVRLAIPRNGEPFGDLSPGTTSRDYWHSFSDEGIFPVAASGPPAVEVSPVVKSEKEPASAEAQIASEDAGKAEASVEAALPATSATLANLYLQQGHLHDAEKAFRELLDEDPGHAQALEGLKEVERRRREADEVEAELATASAAEAPSPANARKIEILTEYLQRLRAAANRN